jgi:hypothetical protein
MNLVLELVVIAKALADPTRIHSGTPKRRTLRLRTGGRFGYQPIFVRAIYKIVGKPECWLHVRRAVGFTTRSRSATYRCLKGFSPNCKRLVPTNSCGETQGESKRGCRCGEEADALWASVNSNANGS